MAIVDDSKLIELSAEPVRNLFPVFRRASALKPLVWLLAVLPGVYALQYNTFDLADAFWGLKSLAMLSAGNLSQVLDPAGIDPPVPYQWYAPLGTWLTAVCQAVVGTAHPVGLALVPYLSTAALIGLTYSLWRLLAGPRFAFLTVALSAFQPGLLQMVQNTAPHALGLMFAMLAFWGYLGHLREARAAASVKLLFGGIGLGLCLLASGPLALMAAAVLACHLLSFRKSLAPVRQGLMAGRRTQGGVGTAFRSLCILLLTAFAVGGWWELMLAAQHGEAFWEMWLTGAAYRHSEAVVTTAQLQLIADRLPVWQSLIGGLGFLIGLAVLGLWQARSEGLHSTDLQTRGCARFVVSWSVSATLIWLGLAVSGTVEGPLLEAARLLAMLSYAPLAAFGIEQIVRRRIPTAAVVGLTAATGLVMYWHHTGGRDCETAVSTLGGWAVFGAVLSVGLGVWSHYCGNCDRRRQLILSSLILALIAGHAASGVLSVRRTTDDDRGMALFRQRLAKVSEPSNCTLITEQESSIRLEYVLKSVWPHLPLQVVPHWDTALSKMTPSPTGANDVHIVVTWGVPDANLQNIGLNLTPISPPQYFRHRQMRAYTLTGAGN